MDQTTFNRQSHACMLIMTFPVQTRILYKRITTNNLLQIKLTYFLYYINIHTIFQIIIRLCNPQIIILTHSNSNVYNLSYEKFSNFTHITRINLTAVSYRTFQNNRQPSPKIPQGINRYQAR